MKITDEIKVELLEFRLKVEDVQLVLQGFLPTTLLVTFRRHEHAAWELRELLFFDGKLVRQAWPCPMPDDVQSWIDTKLRELNGEQS
jgi:hypothetical protein